MSVLRKSVLLSSAAAVLGAGAPAALAQSGGVDQIVVTARKKEENLQNTPIAVTAFSQETLESRQVFNVNEIAQYVPNLQASSSAAGSGAASSFSIRGIGQVDFITTTDPGVGTYLDGVYLARVTGSALELADVERIEVLRGPQGTLFGRNTIGGAVSVITRKPSGEFGLRAQITGGSLGRVQGRAILDMPVIEDVLAAKFTAYGKVTDGYGEDLEPAGGSGELGADDDIAGRAELLWTPASNAEFHLAVDASKRRGTAMPHGRVYYDAASPAGMLFDDGGSNSVIGVNGDVDSDDLDEITVDTPMNDDLDVFGASLTSDFDMGAFNLKFITAYREQEYENGQDYDGGANALLNQFIDAQQWQFSQEVQLTGTAFDDRFDWLLGGYYFTEEARFISDVVLTGLQLDIDTNSKTTSFAGFGQGTFRLTDRLSVTGGVRYTAEKKEIVIDTILGGAPLVLDGMDEQTFNAITPKGSIELQATDQVLLYASVAQGFRSGGFNGRPFSPTDLAPFDEETTTSFEVGVKSDLADNRLRINLAGFYNKYKDIQLTATTTDSMGSFIVITDNAGKIDLYGFEAEVQAAPTDQFFLFGSVGYTKNDGLTPQEGFDFGSDTLPLASEWTASVGGEYTHRLSDRFEAIASADYAYRSSYYPQFNNSEIAKEDGYGLLNARLQLQPVDSNWSLTFWGKNLTDEVYRSFGQDSAVSGIPTVVAYFAPTREYGVTFSIDLN